MCAISASPEAGDASTGIMSARRKYSAISGMEDSQNVFLSRQNKNSTARYTSTIPLNAIHVINNNACDELSVTQNDLLRSISGIEREVDCDYLYYRTKKTDAVLIKDVGVSCNLLSENTIDYNTSIAGIESYLVRQLKLEYNELSNITRKINAYTKDILSSLALRCKRKDQVRRKLYVASKHVMASQYTDETGNACLNLRFHDDTERKCQSSEIAINKSFAEKKIKKEMHENKSTNKQRVEINKTFPKAVLELSPKCSGVLLRNYLITKRGKVSASASKASLRKVENFASSSKLCKNRSNRSRESFYMSKCNPFVLTNWREVSRRKNCKSKNAFIASISSESQSTVNV